MDFEWLIVKEKWPDLFESRDTRVIIQGPIGYTTINRYLISKMRESEDKIGSID